MAVILEAVILEVVISVVVISNDRMERLMLCPFLRALLYRYGTDPMYSCINILNKYQYTMMLLNLWPFVAHRGKHLSALQTRVYMMPPHLLTTPFRLT